MKKIKKSFMIIALLLFYSNNTYATTSGTYTVNEGSAFGKIILFLIAAGLIGIVLFISYKMDKNESLIKRKERILNNKKDFLDEEDALEEIQTISETEEVMDNFNNIDKIYEDIINEEQEDYEEDDEAYVEDELEEDLEEAFLDNIEIEDIESDLLDDEELEEEEEEIIEEPEEVYYNSNDENLNEFTMIFNSKLLNLKEKNKSDEDDFGLEDIKRTIAAANIKKYTRTKEAGNKLVSKKVNKPVKKYTRRKEQPKKKSKVYTRKKIKPVVEQEIENKKIEDDKPKFKRGRPKKVDKPKRGRPKKEVEKPKRGRPKKTDKPKRGRPKKTEASKESKSKK